MQLAAVDSVSRGAADFACSYAADLAVLINGYLIVNLNIAAVQNDGGSAVGNLIAGYVDICQFCPFISIYAILGCNVAGGFDSTVGTADAYIFAGQVAKHDILVQVNLNLSAIMAYADVLVAAEVNIIAGFYVGCFGCNTVSRQIPTCISSVAYFFQLAYVYSVSIGFACCYAADLAVCSNSHLTQLSACGGDLAVVAACIA